MLSISSSRLAGNSITSDRNSANQRAQLSKNIWPASMCAEAAAMRVSVAVEIVPALGNRSVRNELGVLGAKASVQREIIRYVTIARTFHSEFFKHGDFLIAFTLLCLEPLSVRLFFFRHWAENSNITGEQVNLDVVGMGHGLWPRFPQPLAASAFALPIRLILDNCFE